MHDTTKFHIYSADPIYRSGNTFYNDNASYRAFYYTRGQEYIMREDGLHKTDTDDTESLNTKKKYRFNSAEKFDSLKNAQENEIKKMEKSIDSTRNAHKRQMQKLEDSLKKERDRIDEKLESLHAQEINGIRYPYGIMPINAFLSYI